MSIPSPELQNIEQPSIHLTQPLAPGCVLCVDLDGTLVKSDTLVDSVLFIARHRPMDLLRYLLRHT
jgi:hypothetical protein